MAFKNLYSNLACLLILGFCSVESAKILVIFHAPAPSHNILGSALAKGLAEAGHDITFVSPFPEKNPPKNGSYRVVELTGMHSAMSAMRDKMQNGTMFDMSDANPFLTSVFMLPMMSEMCEFSLSNENFQKLIKSNEKFDIVIMEQFVNECFKPVVSLFGAKSLILFSTVGANSWVNPLVGNPSPLSYVPEIFLGYSSKMSFCERTVNLLFYWYTQLLYKLIIFPKQNSQAKKYIHPDANIYDHIIGLLLIEP